MPKGYKNKDILVAEIKMIRAQHQGSILIVEGVDDLRFWRVRIHADCELVEGEGKENVVPCMQKLDNKKIKGVLGVVDADYDTVLSNPLSPDNLAVTDAHDMECILCRSSALHTVLSEFGDSAKIQQFESAAGHDVRSALLRRALVFGRLRCASIYFKFEVNPINVLNNRFFDNNSWEVDEQVLLEESAKPPKSAENLRSEIAKLPDVDPWHVVTGKDMVQILRVGLSSKLGHIRTSVGPKEIVRILRAAMPLSELKATGMGMDIRRWELRNSSYRIFAGSSAPQ